MVTGYRAPSADRGSRVSSNDWSEVVKWIPVPSLVGPPLFNRLCSDMILTTSALNCANVKGASCQVTRMPAGARLIAFANASVGSPTPMTMSSRFE